MCPPASIHYFYRMVRLLLLLFALPLVAHGQLRLSRLELKPKEEFRLAEGDIIVADTLVMGDSSAIWLNSALKDNFIHAKMLRAGKGARIIGAGQAGNRGKDGPRGLSPTGPCMDGAFGKGGTGGTHGESGVNLSLYINEWNIEGSLLIDLRGGDGGDGGHGGVGGGGSTGTRVCTGGNGGVGGNGGTGGNGGDGGTLSIYCKNCLYVRSWLGEKLLVRNFGGFAGLGGNGGLGGSAGLGAFGDTSKDGKNGAKGKAGTAGEQGMPGSINFELN